MDGDLHRCHDCGYIEDRNADDDKQQKGVVYLSPQAYMAKYGNFMKNPVTVTTVPLCSRCQNPMTIATQTIDNKGNSNGIVYRCGGADCQ
jgi:hypothetical protein